MNKSTTNKTLKNSGAYSYTQMVIKRRHTQRLQVLHSKLQNLSEKYEHIKSIFCIS